MKMTNVSIEAGSYTYYCSNEVEDGHGLIELVGCYSTDPNHVVKPKYRIMRSRHAECPLCDQKSQSIIPDSPFLPMVADAKNPRLAGGWAPYGSRVKAYEWLNAFRHVPELAAAIKAIAEWEVFDKARELAKDEEAANDEHATGAWDEMAQVVDANDDVFHVLIASMPRGTKDLERPIGSGTSSPDPEPLKTWIATPDFPKMWALRQAHAINKGLAANSIQVP